MKKPVMRHCVGCMESKPKNELVRIVLSGDEIRLDLSGKANGRGAYVCPDPECVAKAVKNKGLQRSFKMPVAPDVYETIVKELEESGKLEKNA